MTLCYRDHTNMKEHQCCGNQLGGNYCLLIRVNEYNYKYLASVRINYHYDLKAMDFPYNYLCANTITLKLP